MASDRITASLIFAAGKGSRMKGYKGNKTLLPLMADKSSPFKGSHPILLHIIESLPPGPKALVVNHKKEDVIAATRPLGILYYEQPRLNGTGGALLASKEFLETYNYERLIITMGDVPFIESSTYRNLMRKLVHYPMAVLGFRPQDKKQYGVLEIVDGFVTKVTEWKYWNRYPKERQDLLPICNSGIYAVKRDIIIRFLNTLEKKPHWIRKERNGKVITIKEFFITDLVGLISHAGLKVGYVITEDEAEVMGIDDLPSLLSAQAIFKKKYAQR